MKKYKELQIKASVEARAIAQHCKQKAKIMKKRNVFSGFLKMFVIMLLFGVFIFKIKSCFPKEIHLECGELKEFNMRMPFRGEVTSVAKTGEKISSENLHIDFLKPVRFVSNQECDYQMNVKLFGIIPCQEVDIHVRNRVKLIPVGMPIGIYLEGDGVSVVGTGSFIDEVGEECAPSLNVLKSGDIIRKINGQKIDSKGELVDQLSRLNREAQCIELLIERGGQAIEKSVEIHRNTGGEAQLGIWARDNAQGIGTLTYLDNKGNFGALGHGISDADTSLLMAVKGGSIYKTDILKIRMGSKGKPGELMGQIVYADENIYGSVLSNSIKGIYGKYNDKLCGCLNPEPMEVAYKEEIKEGPASILCTNGKEVKEYSAKITATHFRNREVNKELELTITDPELLKLTGGIVQGMSGSPIIQNGRFVGAVTHVFVNDPTKGYGISVEEMLEGQ